MPWSLNAWAAVAGVLLIAAGYGAGRYDGARLNEAGQLRDEHVAQVAYEAAQSATATEIQKLEIRHVTIKQRVERETREVPVYRDCRHSDAGLRAVNAALANAPLPAGDRQLPGDAR